MTETLEVPDIHPSLEDQTRRPSTTRRVVPYLLAAGAYLVVSILVWWHVWTGHPASVMTCGCGDPAASLWYTSWPAYAITHGLNPLFSTTVGFPTGDNLVFAAYGIVLAPFTWLFGPVASLNIALTLSPVLSALAMFALLRRWVAWSPAAFVAGLLYGFSPFVLSNLVATHIDFAMVAVPPLVVICVDELLMAQRRRPVATGVVLGVLLAAQFLIGVEILILLVLEAVLAVGLIAVYAARRRPDELRAHFGPAARGGIAAGLTAVVLLAYPVWFATAGPGHFATSIHPGLNLSALGAPLHSFFVPTAFATRGAFSAAFYRLVGGYQGPVVNGEYIGLGVVAVCAVGALWFRRERLLWLFGILTVTSVLAADVAGSFFDGLPVVGQVVPQHFGLMAVGGAAVMLGVIVDRTRNAVRSRGASPGDTARTGGRRWLAGVAALVVAAVALVPVAAYLAPALPVTTRDVMLPQWFARVAPTLRGHQVVLALPAPFTVTRGNLYWDGPDGTRYPLAFSGKEAAMTWQALDGQRYDMVGGGGLSGGVHHRVAADAGQNVLSEVTFDYRRAVPLTPAAVAAVRRALDTWGVTTVVLPDQPALPAYDQVASVPEMAALVTAATGSRPVRVADAWVWSHVDTTRPTGYPDAAWVRHCTTGRSGADVEQVADCVLAGA